MLGLARRTLGDTTEAEDVVQEAFGRLARVDLDELEDVMGWLAVVVRRLCLDRIRSAHFQHESVTLASLPDGVISLPPELAADPADRITLDDQVQLALAVVLDRLTPAERTSFVLHDIFGFPYAAVGETVGRWTAACRQLASRARRAIREGSDGRRDDIRRADIENEQHRAVSERFIEACAGGDISDPAPRDDGYQQSEPPTTRNGVTQNADTRDLGIDATLADRLRRERRSRALPGLPAPACFGDCEVIPDPLGREAVRAGAARRIGSLMDAECLATRVGVERIVRSGVQWASTTRWSAWVITTRSWSVR